MGRHEPVTDWATDFDHTDDAYAAEELIAEMGSAFLCAHCRIDGQLPGHIDGLPRSDALRIGADGSGSIGGNDHLFHPIFSFSIYRGGLFSPC